MALSSEERSAKEPIDIVAVVVDIKEFIGVIRWKTEVSRGRCDDVIGFLRIWLIIFGCRQCFFGVVEGIAESGIFLLFFHRRLSVVVIDVEDVVIGGGWSLRRFLVLQQRGASFFCARDIVGGVFERLCDIDECFELSGSFIWGEGEGVDELVEQVREGRPVVLFDEDLRERGEGFLVIGSDGEGIDEGESSFFEVAEVGSVYIGVDAQVGGVHFR